MSVAVRRAMIERHHATLSLSAQCRLISLSRSSFYYAPMPETPETLALMAVIDATFLDCPWYGSRQMARHLKREGYGVGCRKVRRLMTKMGLSPIYQRPRTSDPHPVDDMPAAMIDFDTARPGERLWDLGHSAFTWLDLGNDDHAPGEQIRRLSVFAEGYGHAECTISRIAVYALTRQVALAASAQARGKGDIARWAASCADWTALNLVERLLPIGYS